MFEKEAEEYRKDLKSKFFLSEPQLDLACQGFKDGYKKANEWHYVKDGDLPKEVKEYLVYKIDGYGCKSIQVMQFNNRYCWCANCQNEIIAWKEIVLPELPKELENDN